MKFEKDQKFKDSQISSLPNQPETPFDGHKSNIEHQTKVSDLDISSIKNPEHEPIIQGPNHVNVEFTLNKKQGRSLANELRKVKRREENNHFTFMNKMKGAEPVEVDPIQNYSNKHMKRKKDRKSLDDNLKNLQINSY